MKLFVATTYALVLLVIGLRQFGAFAPRPMTTAEYRDAIVAYCDLAQNVADLDRPTKAEYIQVAHATRLHFGSLPPAPDELQAAGKLAHSLDIAIYTNMFATADPERYDANREKLIASIRALRQLTK